MAALDRKPKLSRVLLAWLILCGIRLARKANPNLRMYRLDRCAQGMKKALDYFLAITRAVQHKWIGTFDAGNELHCSSIPYNVGTQRQCSDLPQTPTVAKPRKGYKLAGASTTQRPEEQPGQDLASSHSSFLLHPLAPFRSIRPITTAQLVPRRWPISREGPTDLPNTFTHTMMIPERAARGYVPPYTTNFTPDLMKPGWSTFLHPQGSVYYFNEGKKIATNANIFHNQTFEILQDVADKLYQQLQQDSIEIPSDAQLVLDIRWDTLKIGYYFATLQGRCLFWAQEKYLKSLYKRVENVWSHSHMNVAISSSGRRLHHQYFPHIQTLTPQVLREMKGFLLYTTADHMFNTKTASEFSAEEVDKCLDIVNSIPQELILSERKDLANTHHGDGYYMWIVGSIMALSALHKFDNYHGQPNARWNRDDLLFYNSNPESRTLFISFLSPVLFYVPETYYHSLSHVLNEGSVFFEAWRTFVKELHHEWNGLTIIATVLLATNMAFLAIPSLDNGDRPDLRSPAQICSYLSIVFSVSSIVLGQLFSRYHRIKGWEHFDERITENFNFLLDLGCSQLAIMYSLPYALLSWSLIAFLVAFLVMCFSNTQGVVRLILGVASAVVALVVFYCVWRMKANDEERGRSSTLVNLGNGLRNALVACCIWPRAHSEPGPSKPSTPKNSHRPPSDTQVSTV